jgi:hypothetical protein
VLLGRRGAPSRRRRGPVAGPHDRTRAPSWRRPWRTVAPEPRGSATCRGSDISPPPLLCARCRAAPSRPSPRHPSGTSGRKRS